MHKNTPKSIETPRSKHPNCCYYAPATNQIQPMLKGLPFPPLLLTTNHTRLRSVWRYVGL